MVIYIEYVYKQLIKHNLINLLMIKGFENVVLCIQLEKIVIM